MGDRATKRGVATEYGRQSPEAAFAPMESDEMQTTIKQSAIVLLGWASLVGLAWWQAYHRDLARCRGNAGWLYWNCVDAHSLIRDNIALAGVALPMFAVAGVMILQLWARPARHRSPATSDAMAPTMPKAIRDTFYGRSADAP